MLNFQYRHYVIGVIAVVLIAIILYPILDVIYRKPKGEETGIMDANMFKKSTVHMGNPDKVREILSLLLKGGPQKLQVITDFDHTLSRMHMNGNVCDSTYCILERGPFTPEENRIQANILFEKYYPIEIDPTLSKAEKTPYMLEWYMKSRNLMITSGIKQKDIYEIVKSSNAELRDGCDILFKTLLANEIPVLIFSAGIGDILQEILKQRNLLLPNMKVIANFIQFNDKGEIRGFQNQLIHTFNKNQYSVKNSDYFEKLESRTNIVLLGDSLGDTDMSEGAEGLDCILKIGFLNKKIQESMSEYLKAYDVVLADDQSMDFVNELLQMILKSTKGSPDDKE